MVGTVDGDEWSWRENQEGYYGQGSEFYATEDGGATQEWPRPPSGVRLHTTKGRAPGRSPRRPAAAAWAPSAWSSAGSRRSRSRRAASSQGCSSP